MAERSKAAQDLQPGDRVQVADPWGTARIVSNNRRMTKLTDARGLPAGETPEQELVFDFLDGARRGERDYTFLPPEAEVALA